jgi:hypothetical protein
LQDARSHWVAHAICTDFSSRFLNGENEFYFGQKPARSNCLSANHHRLCSDRVIGTRLTRYGTCPEKESVVDSRVELIYKQ